jgi:hypothetical protein
LHFRRVLGKSKNVALAVFKGVWKILKVLTLSGYPNLFILLQNKGRFFKEVSGGPFPKLDL